MALDLELVSMINTATFGSAVLYLTINLQMPLTDNRAMLLREMVRIELKTLGIGVGGSDEPPSRYLEAEDNESLSALSAAVRHGVQAWRRKSRLLLGLDDS